MGFIDPNLFSQYNFRKVKPSEKPANPRAEDLSFFVLEVLSKVGANKLRKLSQTLFRPEDTSGLIPRGSKTEPLELKRRKSDQQVG